MPGRARMIVAVVPDKDLELDWRHGAAHFQRHLIDWDLACNQLNWQWVAGTGTDPNAHRVFNPAVQGRRSTRPGDTWAALLPELAGLPAAAVHSPDAAARARLGLPPPLVDHRAAIAEYRQRRGKS